MCNTSNNNKKNGYDYAVTDDGIAYFQGSFSAPAGNTFSLGTSSTGAPTGSDFNNGASTGAIIYFYNNGTNLNPTNVFNTAKLLITQSNSCPSKPTGDKFSGGIFGELTMDYNNSVGGIFKVKSELDEKIDRGETKELIAQLEAMNEKEASKVLDRILAVSPFLSKVTFKAMVDQEKWFSQDELLKVAIANPDLFRGGNLYQWLEEKRVLSDDELNVLKEKTHQVNTERTSLEIKLGELEAEKQSICNKALVGQLT